MWMPLLQVRLGREHIQTPRFKAIVDSGSPYSMFNASIAQYLGIDIAKGIQSKIGGISQAIKEPIYFHRVRVYVESDWVIDITAGFVRRLSIAGILGRNGFFDNFKVLFDQSETPAVMDIEKIHSTQ